MVYKTHTPRRKTELIYKTNTRLENQACLQMSLLPTTADSSINMVRGLWALLHSLHRG